MSEELEFRTGETDGEPTFIWRDLEGDVDELYEFVAIDMNAPTRAFFEMCMYRAMYERKYRKGGDDVPEADLEEFVWVCVPFTIQPSTFSQNERISQGAEQGRKSETSP